jgi:hypothetical protein
MKIKTALKSGSVVNDAASLGCQALRSGASVFDSADYQVYKLANSVTGTTQSALNTAKSWLGLS